MSAQEINDHDRLALGAEPALAEEDDDSERNVAPRFRLTAAEKRARRNRRLAFRDSSEDGHGRILNDVGEGAEASYPMTYQPARFEAVWLRASLRSFYDQELIVDVLAQVKGGKEANVYRCRAHPRTGAELLAAKVYRPRQFRNLANDQLYREGRPVLTADGRPAKATDQRIMRALGKKTEFGAQIQHTSWLMYEYLTLGQIHQAGGAVPRPFGANENGLLMGYQGNARLAAPPLREISLGRREAGRQFAEVMRNVELLLQHGLVHGDLSAYNILYWEGRITLIDFPQATSVHANRNAQVILQRDVKRVCDYFARQGVRADPVALAADLWDRYGEGYYRDPMAEAAEQWEAEDDERDD
ncbi:MAG: RIO1 family regulatory kinase/ATPase [Chloroflexota bacterium]